MALSEKGELAIARFGAQAGAAAADAFKDLIATLTLEPGGDILILPDGSAAPEFVEAVVGVVTKGLRAAMSAPGRSGPVN